MLICHLSDAILRFLEIIVSWPLIILLLVFLFMPQIKDLLSRLKEGKIKTPFGEFEFEPKMQQTDLGRTGMSKVAVKRSNTSLVMLEGIQETYVSDNFLISWPKNKWSCDTGEGGHILQQIGLSAHNRKIPIIIRKNEQINNFVPNINIVIESIGNISLDEYVDISIKSMKQNGWEVESFNIEKDFDMGFISFFNSLSEPKLYQFQRIAITANLAYIVTASIAKDTLVSKVDISDLLAIFNSFRFIV